MDLANLLNLPEHDGDTCKMERRTVASWSHLRIKITNVKTKQLLLLFTALLRPSHRRTLSQHPPCLSRLDGAHSKERSRAESAD